MLMLAVSTSGPRASAALLQDDALLSYAQSDAARTHSETLMPLVESVLAQADKTPADVDVFAADTGPGSFTGVRIGVCAINAMAAATGKAVLGVSALEALAFQREGCVCTLLDARNGNGYAALYDNGACIVPPCAVVLAEFIPTVPADAAYVGDSMIALPQGQVEQALLRADAVGHCAWTHYQQEGAAAGEILPLYLRPSQAERLYKEK